MNEEGIEQGEESPEEWRPVFEWEGVYEVSNRSRIRKVKGGRIMKQRPDHDGYYKIGLSAGGAKRKTAAPHRLMLFAFRGHPLPGQESRHLDNDRSNNQLSNVVWGTREENDADRVARHAAKKAAMPPPPECARQGCFNSSTPKEEYCCRCRAVARKQGIASAALPGILRNPDGSPDHRQSGAAGGRARTAAKTRAAAENLAKGRVFRPTVVDLAAMSTEEMESRAAHARSPGGKARWLRRIERRNLALSRQQRIEAERLEIEGNKTT